MSSSSGNFSAHFSISGNKHFIASIG
ncbi:MULTISPECIES: LCI fold-containing protein [Lachnospiraceae]